MLAEADAVLPEGRPAVLVEALHLLGDLAARQHAERLDEAEGDAAGHAAQALVVAERDQRREMLGDAAVEPVAEPALHLLGDGGLGVVVDEGPTCGLSASAPATSLPTACSPHISPPCSVTSISVSGAL